jgi:glycosyltransferase involved in cell wall biosynthesis
MRILHYGLGFPPYRSGGLTKYSVDLAVEQAKEGNQVGLLWPGEINRIKKFKVKKRKTYQNVENLEIINPLPVPLDEGIKEIDEFIKKCDQEICFSFLKKWRPDVFHIHTLMGLNKEWVDACNRLNIKTIFTTHDYFGICPKVTLYRKGNICECMDCTDCVDCNERALSLTKIKILQSPIYRIIKGTKFIKTLRKKHRGEYFSKIEETEKNNILNDELVFKYKKLREYYKAILESIDLLHFNSTVTEQVYKKYVKPKNSIVMSISHKGIKNNKVEKKKNEKLCITMLAPAKSYKGYFILIDALDQLWEEGKHDFVLNMYSPVPENKEYINVKEDGFSQKELANIFEKTDVLIAPSIWYETFGFTVLEAISYGVPVIISNRVGAKDIVGENGIIVEANNSKELKKALMTNDFQAMRENMLETRVKEWKDFVIENYSNYK